ncbi:MAG: hypothetical protein FJW14_10005 [Acidimicrobiia bacterium]|nr:hypothetical protein [Acidimicrobiia bacterium]
MRQTLVAVCTLAGVAAAAQQQGPPTPPNPRQQPGAMVHIFAPEQHDLYDGHFGMEITWK